MKDQKDKATRELFDKPRRGRPSTGKAKTQAQIQREYRARKKSTLEQLPTLAQALAGFEVWYLPKGCRKWRKSSGHDSLSWSAAQSHARSLILACEIAGPDYQERVEIRPVMLEKMTTNPNPPTPLITPREAGMCSEWRNIPRRGTGSRKAQGGSPGLSILSEGEKAQGF